jgi:hypothetical protein
LRNRYRRRPVLLPVLRYSFGVEYDVVIERLQESLFLPGGTVGDIILRAEFLAVRSWRLLVWNAVG